MEKLTDVLNLGGYGVYVWPSYALAIAVMSGMAFIGMRLLRRSQRALAAIEKSLHEA